MISISMNDKTFEISGVNTSFIAESGLYQLWATKKADGKSVKLYESENEQDVTVRKKGIDTAIEEGEYLVQI